MCSICNRDYGVNLNICVLMLLLRIYFLQLSQRALIGQQKTGQKPGFWGRQAVSNLPTFPTRSDHGHQKTLLKPGFWGRLAVVEFFVFVFSFWRSPKCLLFGFRLCILYIHESR